MNDSGMVKALWFPVGDSSGQPYLGASLVEGVVFMTMWVARPAGKPGPLLI